MLLRLSGMLQLNSLIEQLNSLIDKFHQQPDVRDKPLSGNLSSPQQTFLSASRSLSRNEILCPGHVHIVY
jgi:hypothetical protein